MTVATRILSQIESGDPSAAEQQFTLVYDELRELAAAKLTHEKPRQTLHAMVLDSILNSQFDENIQWPKNAP